MLFFSFYSPQKESRLNNIIEGLKNSRKKQEVGDEKENQASPSAMMDDDVMDDQPISDKQKGTNENEAEHENGELCTKIIDLWGFHYSVCA